MEPRSIGESLRGFLRSSDVVKRSRATQRWTEVWRQVAEPAVLAHTEVRGVRQGVLTIAVDSPPLLHELASFRREALLRALNDRAEGEALKDLFFRHAPL
jgi:predicted nucleic acid-binding Zn ribbon protein